MRKDWIAAVSLALNVVLLVLVISQGNRLGKLEGEVRDSSAAMESELMRMQNAIVSSVADTLEEMEQPIADLSIEPTGLDAADRVLTADVVLQLREWEPGAAVELTVSTPSGEDTQTRAADENGICRIPVRIPAEGTGEIRMAAAVTVSGTIARQDLGWKSAEMLLPVQCDGGGCEYSFDKKNGKTALGSCDVYLNGLDGEPAEARDPVFRLLCNGETVQEQPGQPVWEDDILRYSCGDWQPHPGQAGDQLEITFTCTDDFGLSYTFAVFSYQVAEDGSLWDTAGTSDFLTLTWPE